MNTPMMWLRTTRDLHALASKPLMQFFFPNEKIPHWSLGSANRLLPPFVFVPLKASSIILFSSAAAACYFVWCVRSIVIIVRCPENCDILIVLTWVTERKGKRMRRFFFPLSLFLAFVSRRWRIKIRFQNRLLSTDQPHRYPRRRRTHQRQAKQWILKAIRKQNSSSPINWTTFLYRIEINQQRYRYHWPKR